MKIINLNYDGLMSNSYLVFINDKIYLVDPSIDVKTLKKYINKLDGILITHGHFDHISYLKEIYDFYKPKVYCHKNACIKIKDNVLNCSKYFGLDKKLDIENYEIVYESFKIDDIFRVMETPGHTDCSIMFIIKDLEKIQGDKTIFYDNVIYYEYNNIIFSGDTLFKKSIGRTDLYTGSMGDMLKTLRRIKEIDCSEDYLILPGHEDVTSLASEKECNEYLIK